jgi:hypothetical protein
MVGGLLGGASTATSQVPPRENATALPLKGAAVHRAAKPPVVSLKLDRARTTTAKQVGLTIVVRPAPDQSASARARQLRSLRTGRVKVVEKGGGRQHSIRARLVDHRVHVLLPGLVPSVHRVRATFLGNQLLRRAQSPTRSLVVLAPRGTSAHFPRAGTTGVPAGVTLHDYKGPCVIQTDHTVIDGKTIGCGLTIQARHVVIKNSSLRTVWLDQDVMHAQHRHGWSVRIVDSVVDGGHSDGPGVCCGNYRVVRVEMKGGHNGAQCENGASYCVLTDSWIHAQYEPSGGLRHLGGFLNDGGTPTTLIHNRITCDAWAENDEGGCTGDVNLIPNFGVMAGVLVQNNYLGANANAAYCTYAGATPGLPGYARRSNHIVYVDNVFGKNDVVSAPAPHPGSTKRCADYGPVTGFDVDGPGNYWNSNHYENGTVIVCGRKHRCD